MTDFFSRIFSIPSDDSSAYSSDVYRADDGGGGGGGNNGSKHNAGSGGGRNAKMRKDKKKKKKEERGGGGRNNKSRPSLPPPPQCTTGGNDTITSSKASPPASSRAASDSVLGKSAWSGASSTGSDTETTGGRRSYEYPRDDDDDDDGGDHGRDSDRRALRPNGGGSGGRGRRRRDDSRVPQSRSASEQPRGSSRKVGSVAATACDKAHRLPVQPQPVQTSPTRRHRSLSTTRKGGTPAPSGMPPAAAASSPRGDPVLVPIRSWSSGGEDEDEEEEGEEDERAGLRGRRHRSSTSSSAAAAAAAAHERSSSSVAARRKRHRQQPTAKQQEDDRARHHSYGGTKTSSAAGNNVETTTMTTTTTSTRQQHEKVNWLSRTFAGVGGGSKKNSPGSGGGGGGGATQSQHWSKRGTSKTRRPTPEILAVDEANEKATAATDRRGQKPRSASQRGGDIRDRDAKLNLPSPGGGGGQQRKQPIHVGDSIVIPHHEFLVESMEMSVLTMPLEFMTIATTGGCTSANEEELRDVEPSTGGVPSKYENFAINVQEVGRRTVLENAIVKAYYSNGHAGQDDVDVMATTTGVSSAEGPDGPAYPKIGAYASRFLEDGTGNRNIYQSYSRDQSIVHDREDGIEVSPANRLGLATAPHAKLGVSQHHGEEEGGEIDSRAPPGAGAGKHQWPCDPSAEGYSLKLNGGGLPLSPPPPPPMPPPLPRWALPLDYVPGQSSRHQVAASCTTPAGGNSETVAAGYNDPPGSLSEPVAHPPDPPGDEFRPFDEGSSGLCSDGVMYDRRAAPMLAAQQPTGQHKLRFSSSKAVTFSLPPLKTTSRNATPSPALTNRALTFWSSSQLLPPIVEIWSSVECPNNMPGGIGCSALNWDEKKECELLGEEVPLHVSDEWIDIRDEEEGKEEAKTAAITLMTTAPAPAPAAVAGSWEVGGASRHLFHSIDDLPDDEYLEDILNCEEEDFSHKSKSSNHFDNDIDYRHRSTWNTAYKPPKLSSSSEDSVRVNEDNWNIMNRKKAIAVIAIQRCVRGMLERQRLRSLLSSVLIMQLFIRRYISRRRYQTYLKLKQSYYPRRWERRNNSSPKK
jgi:hypothetical protein